MTSLPRFDRRSTLPLWASITNRSPVLLTTMTKPSWSSGGTRSAAWRRTPRACETGGPERRRCNACAARRGRTAASRPCREPAAVVALEPPEPDRALVVGAAAARRRARPRKGGEGEQERVPSASPPRSGETRFDFTPGSLQAPGPQRAGRRRRRCRGRGSGARSPESPARRARSETPRSPPGSTRGTRRRSGCRGSG